MPPEQQPTLFCLHGLGLSGHLFDGLADALGPDFAVVPIDLPGFGEASAARGLTVDEMVAHVERKMRRNASARFLLVGHSMGGKVASLVASRTLNGSNGLFGLAGVVLLAGSPPTPEPMSDEARAEMLAWGREGVAGDGHIAAGAARSFVDGNVGAPLGQDADALAVGDAQRSAAEAWVAWSERGSREDRGAEVGTLDVPALLVAGGDDGPLGEAGQRDTNAQVYPRASLEVLAGAGHLLPLERPAEVGALIRSFWRESAGSGPAVSSDFGRMIASGRTSSQTRAILARRAVADDESYEPRVLTSVQLATLRVVADLVVPQGSLPIDLAARCDAQLARGDGDGWRHVALPPDAEAYAAGLDALDDLADLGRAERTALVERIVDGSFEPRGGTLDRTQMTLWFEDCRVDLTRLWLAHPATMERIGFDGFANGGDAPRIQGFELLGAGERGAWEPAMPVGVGPEAPATATATATEAAATGVAR